MDDCYFLEHRCRYTIDNRRLIYSGGCRGGQRQQKQLLLYCKRMRKGEIIDNLIQDSRLFNWDILTTTFQQRLSN